MKILTRSTTIMVRLFMTLMGVAALAFCAWLPFMKEGAAQNPGYLLYPFVAYVYVSAVPFFIALYQGFKLMGYIDANKVFSKAAAQSLGIIKYCTIVMLAFIAVAIAYVLSQTNEDGAGVIALGTYLALGTTIVGSFALIFQKLIQNAVVMKSENDLTV